MPSFRKMVTFILLLVFCQSVWSLYTAPTTATETGPTDAYTPPMADTPARRTLPAGEVQALIDSRPKAAFISLVRNEELQDMVASILQVESRFNGRATHQYDWVFFNNEEFTPEFQATVLQATNSRCFFEKIPVEHWRVPSWIDETRFSAGRQFMGGIGVGKAWLQSYHHMCRWNAGLFALEERLADYDWYWRVEPAVKFHCDINYDVFRFMEENNLAYGFNMAILDDARSFPSLWEQTKAFIDQNSELVDKDADFNWLLYTDNDQDDVIRPHTGAEEGLSDGEYNNCQFYSNFEIGSLNFFRGKEHRSYFDHLDQAGGFYYERLGDAPVHTISVSLFLPKNRLWFFRDIGYAHGLCEQCPPHQDKQEEVINSHLNAEVEVRARGTQVVVVAPFQTLDVQHRRWKTIAQDVERQKGIPGLSCGCTVSALDDNNAKLVPYESKQRKPSDTCIRKFLGGKWLARKDMVSDINSVAGIVAGGLGPGYVLNG
ncbi:glycosyltransferase family 15 protein [Hypoxylon sp. FL1150]|nr:glycosyltransferase family 15 protein [Hypoxylon sp. FL1150]